MAKLSYTNKMRKVMKNKRILSLIILVIIMSFVLTGCSYFMPSEKGIYVPELEKSKKIILPTTNVFVGDLKIMYSKGAKIVPDIKMTDTIECGILGKIEEVYVDVGQQVEKNQLIAVLNVEIINEKIFKQEISVEKATMSYDRQLVLNKLGKADLYAVKISLLTLESARNYLNDLNKQLEQHYIYAKSEGIVTEIFKVTGDNAKGKLLSICPKENFLVQYEVEESDSLPKEDEIMISLKSGKDQKLNIKIIYEGKEYDGYVFRNSYEYSLAYNYYGNSTYGQIAFVQIAEAFIIGKAATIRYIEDEAFEVMVIPVSTVYKGDEELYYTYVVNDNEIEYREIEVGITDGVFYEVISGLNKNEKILKSR